MKKYSFLALVIVSCSGPVERVYRAYNLNDCDLSSNSKRYGFDPRECKKHLSKPKYKIGQRVLINGTATRMPEKACVVGIYYGPVGEKTYGKKYILHGGRFDTVEEKRIRRLLGACK